MYVTREQVKSLLDDIQKNLDASYWKRRKEYKVYTGEERATLLYMKDILTDIYKMLKKGNYSRDRIIEALQEQDWVGYSFRGKAGDSQTAKIRLGLSKKVSITDALYKQGWALEDASKMVIDLLLDL